MVKVPVGVGYAGIPAVIPRVLTTFPGESRTVSVWWARSTTQRTGAAAEVPFVDSGVDGVDIDVDAGPDALDVAPPAEVATWNVDGGRTIFCWEFPPDGRKVSPTVPATARTSTGVTASVAVWRLRRWSPRARTPAGDPTVASCSRRAVAAATR
jgi:hypothetical protein